MTTVIDRIRQIIDNKGFSERHFCREIGVANGFLNKVNDVGSDKLNKILYKYPEINPIWLLTGNGSMLTAASNIYRDDETKSSPSIDKGWVPLVTESALKGIGDTNFSIQETDIREYYVIPKFKHRNIDFMIEVSDNSMYPRYNSGDLVACTIIKGSSFIQWNKTYVVVTDEQGVLIKRIKKGAIDSKAILAVSDNESYEPFEIPKKEIIGMAIVSGVVRLE